MQIIKKTEKLLKSVRFFKNQKMTIGFVPTMGALHSGHLSLIDEAKRNNDVVIASIFVNPAQFNDAKDLENYPRTTAADMVLLEKVDCDIVFLPDVSEVYPPGLSFPVFELGHLNSVMEGAYRPGHFDGVVKVVYRFLDILKPHKLYLGQKDYQQVKVIETLIKQSNLETQIFMCPTIRNNDGLAQSSRNTRLTESDKEKATYIYDALKNLNKSLKHEPVNVSENNAKLFIEDKTGGQVEYLGVFDLELKNKIKDYNPGMPAIVCVAVKVGDVRLIDNLIIS